MTAPPLELRPREDAVDLAPFGRTARWSEGGAGGLCVAWNEAREVHTVIVELTGAARVPALDRIRIEWWCSRWPDEGSGGWMKGDDPWNGRWLKAGADTAIEHAAGRSIVLRFRPLAAEEHPDAGRLGFPYRRTLQVRAALDGEAGPAIERLRIYGNSVWKRAELVVELGGSTPIHRWDATVEMANGEVLAIEPLDGAAARIIVRYADAAERTSNDRGALTVRAPRRSFTCFVDDVVREGSIWIRGVDAFVSADGSRADAPRVPGAWLEPIVELVADRPEQTRVRAMTHIPAKPPMNAPLGVPGGRHEFMHEPNGDIAMVAMSLRSAGPDVARRGWSDEHVRYAVATAKTPDFAAQRERTTQRWLEDDELPVVNARWRTGDLEFTQTAFATVLAGGLDAVDERTGAEPLVCLVRLRIENRGVRAERAHVWLQMSHRAESVVAADGLLEHVEPPGPGARQPWLHTLGRFETHGAGAPEIALFEGRSVVHHACDLAPGESAIVDLAIPYLQLLDEAERTRLRELAFPAERLAVEAFWRSLLDRGMQIETPDGVLDAFYRSNLWRVLVSNDRDPHTGLTMAPAATVAYGVFANETCMIARSLEMRGLYDEAARILEPFFRFQGTKPLAGRFSADQSAVFYSAGDYTHLPYTMHHGFVLWAAGEHFLWSGDRAWFAERAPALVRGCDWITRERQSTMHSEAGRRAPESGLLPAHQLEDVEEYQYWYATNAYAALGMQTVGEALREADRPEAGRILADARAFRDDILASAEEMWTRTPAVRLLDGSYVPYLPPRVYGRTHCVEGWVRESLYSALHLWEAGLYDAHDPRVAWMLLDLEDNVFVSPESGYPLDPLEEKWFDWGGFCPQPCLLGNGLAHLARGERKHFLRVFWNVFAASLYPDTKCFTEWVPEHGRGGGPLYKAPDECKFVQWLRLMLIREDGDALELCSGLPSAWLADGCRTRVARAPTRFGELEFELRSELRRDRITFTARLPRRRCPARVVLHVSHPEARAIRRVVLNGALWRATDAAAGIVPLPPERSEVAVTIEY